MVEEEVEPKQAACTKCGYIWQTKSKLGMVSCPSCGAKVKLTVVQ